MKSHWFNVCTILLWFTCTASVAQYQEGFPYYMEGEYLRRIGQHERAISEFNKALQQEPANYSYLLARAQSELQLKRLDAALHSLQGALKIKNDLASAHALIAGIYRSRNEIEKATHHYEEAFNYETDLNKKVRYKILVVQKLIKDNNWAQAYQKIREAYAVAPQNEVVIYYLARLGNKIGKHSEVIEAISQIEDKISAWQPAQNAKYYYELGYAWYQLEEYEKAKQAWKKVDSGPYKAQLERFSPKYFCNLSVAYFRVYENELAQQYAERASKIEDTNTAAYVLLAQIAKRNANHSSAIASLQNALHSTTDRMKQLHLYIQLAELHCNAHQYNKAIQAAEEAQKISFAEPKTLLLRSVALYKTGDYKAVIEYLQTMLQNEQFDTSTTAEMNFLMGLAAKKAGNIQLAKQSFSIAGRSPLFKDAAQAELATMTVEAIE